MGVREAQSNATRKYFFDADAPFTGKSFYPLSRHLNYFIRPSICYPVAYESIPLSVAARQAGPHAATIGTPLLCCARIAPDNSSLDANIRRVPASAMPYLI